MQVKVAFSKMGAELRRVERQMEAVGEDIETALSICTKALASYKEAKGQVNRMRATWENIHKRLKEMEEREAMEQSLNDGLALDEVEMDAGRSEEKTDGREDGMEIAAGAGEEKVETGGHGEEIEARGNEVDNKGERDDRKVEERGQVEQKESEGMDEN